MGKQPNRGGPSDQTAPGKPSSRQPPDANTGKGNGRGKDGAENRDKKKGQEIPKTGRDQSMPIEQD
jgi:hypothetical protein